MRSIRCPSCNQHVLQKSEGGKVRLRLKGALVSDSDGLHGSCRWCGTKVTLPLVVQSKALAAGSSEKLILRARARDS